jgi:hypothetical protein
MSLHGFRNSSVLSPNQIVSDGLVLYLDASDSRSYPGSGTSWTDLTTNGYVGTLNGGMEFDSSNSGSLSFDGIDDEVSTTYTGISGTSPRSLVMWVKIATDRDSRLFTYGISANGQRWTFRADSTFYTPRIEIGGGNYYSTDNNFKIAKNEWVMCSVVYPGNSSSIFSHELYFNNSLCTSMTGTDFAVNTVLSPSVLIGVGPIPASVKTLGNISQVLFYDRALSSTEISQNFNALRGRYGI